MDWGTVVMGVVAASGTIATAVYATRGKVAEVASTTQVALAATAQRAEEVKVKADDDFQTRILHELQRTQEKLDALSEKHNALAVEHAELRGEVKILREARTTLTAEITALKAENTSIREAWKIETTDLKKRLRAMDEENEAQGLKLAEYAGRIAQLTGVTP